MARKKPEEETISQGEAFKTAARALGCDESEERFDAALRTVAKHKPPPDAKPAKPKKLKPAK